MISGLTLSPPKDGSSNRVGYPGHQYPASVSSAGDPADCFQELFFWIESQCPMVSGTYRLQGTLPCVSLEGAGACQELSLPFPGCSVQRGRTMIKHLP